jgi:hypothetical protein
MVVKMVVPTLGSLDTIMVNVKFLV